MNDTWNTLKEKQFKKDIILVIGGYYCRFSLSYRDVSELLRESGISVHPITSPRFVHEYSNSIYQMWKKKNTSTHFAWHLDDTYIKVKEYTLDIQLHKTRAHQVAYVFIKRLGIAL